MPQPGWLGGRGVEGRCSISTNDPGMFMKTKEEVKMSGAGVDVAVEPLRCAEGAGCSGCTGGTDLPLRGIADARQRCLRWPGMGWSKREESVKKSKLVILSEAKDPSSLFLFSDLRATTEILRCAQDDTFRVPSHLVMPTADRCFSTNDPGMSMKTKEEAKKSHNCVR